MIGGYATEYIIVYQKNVQKMYEILCMPPMATMTLDYHLFNSVDILA